MDQEAICEEIVAACRGTAIVPAFDVRNAQECPSRVITRAAARNEIYATQFPEITFGLVERGGSIFYSAGDTLTPRLTS